MMNFPYSLPVLANGFRSSQIDLLDYLAQLEVHFEQREPDVLAFVPEHGRFVRLKQEARQLLTQYPDPAERPPFFGVPIGVKDIFHTDGFVTRAGSELPAHLFQGEEAASVRRLKQAGALILGKTVTTEFAFFAPGPTRNPHNPAHTPGGSSSGSAAAVASGLCPLALGTQTIGSINRPAAYCGVVGFKPSYGRIPTTGIIPLSPSLDHVGFFTSDVAGAEWAASLLVDHWQIVITERQPVLGIPDGPYLNHATPEGLTYFRQTCTRLEEAGFTLKPVAAMPDFDHLNDDVVALVQAELAQVHADWFPKYAGLYQPKTAELIRQGQQVTEERVVRVRNGRIPFRHYLTQLMDQHGIDLWLSPSAQGPAPEGLASTGSPVMNLPWTYAGLPTLTLPAGVNEAGLPLGLQLVGHWFRDEVLLAWAETIESVLSSSHHA
jgi:Asp-tRNA(Asn)/Glu-tRNA(Gln) amidotransferase A subunit family amidase